MTAEQVLTWSDQLSTGLPDVDDQHQRLIELINTMGDIRTRGAEPGELAAVLAQLRDYTVYHFQHEEDLMASLPVNQANKASHIKDHQGFVNIVLRAEGMVGSNPADVTDHLLAFLVKWLVHHITGIDTRMANNANELFGVERLCQALRATRADQGIAAVKKAMARHLGSATSHDDISLMLINC
jgi:hemerythrin-like metal-binding protein